MDSLESLKIDLKDLDVEAISLDCRLDDTFFKSVNGDEVKGGQMQLSVSAHKSVSGLYEISYTAKGEVVVECDLCLDDMMQPISAEGSVMARLGEEYSDEDDIVTVAKDDTVLDISWFVYESIALEIPIKHVHAPGKCNPAMIKALKEHTATRSSDGSEAAVDPRWSELEKLKSIIKD